MASLNDFFQGEQKDRKIYTEKKRGIPVVLLQLIICVVVLCGVWILKDNQNVSEAMSAIKEETMSIESAWLPLADFFAVDGNDAGASMPPSFSVPLSGTVAKDFGAEDEGVLISASDGSEVKAAAEGEISSVDNTDGKITVSIAHEGDLMTIYENLASVNCKVGEKVEKGVVLGTLAGENLRFSMTLKGEPCDPFAWLFPNI